LITVPTPLEDAVAGPGVSEIYPALASHLHIVVVSAQVIDEEGDGDGGSDSDCTDDDNDDVHVAYEIFGGHGGRAEGSVAPSVAASRTRFKRVRFVSRWAVLSFSVTNVVLITVLATCPNLPM
jgi:hypothetical protein